MNCGSTTGGSTSSTTTTPIQNTTVKTPESTFKEDFTQYLGALHDADVGPCLPMQVAGSQEGMAWRENPKTKASIIALAYELTTNYLARYKATIGETTAVCPTIEEMEAQGYGMESADCREVEEDCRARARPVYLTEGEAVFLERVQGCMDNHPANKDCTFSGSMEGVGEEQVGGTCASDAECADGWRCDTVNYHERPPRARSPIGAMVLPDTFLGRCIPKPELPEGACEQDADCGEGFLCKSAPQTSVPCPQGTCLGRCTEKEMLHPVADDGEREGCRPVDVAAVQEELANLSTKEKLEALREYHAQCEAVKEGVKGEEEEAQDDAVIAQLHMELAPLLSEATLKLVTLNSSSSGLPGDLRTLVQEGLTLVGEQLGILAEGRQVDVGRVIEMLRDVHEKLPQDVVERFDRETRVERTEEALGGVRMELRKIGDMLDWIDTLITKLEEADYRGGNVAEWRKLLTTAMETFYEDMLPRCEQLAETLRSGGSGNMEQCFRNIEEIFRPLEYGMKPVIEREMERGDNETLMAIMMEIGMPPMDEGGQHGPGGPGGPGMDPAYCFDACEQRLGITNLITRSDEQCVKPQAPHCIEAESETPECEALFSACDLQVLGPDISRALSMCQDACARGMGGERRQEGYDMRQQQRVDGERFTHMYMNAALYCCSINKGGDFACIDQALPPVALQFQPNILLPGVDMECPVQEGYGSDCSGPWDNMHRDCERFGRMDPMCMLEHVKMFPVECQPPAENPIWNISDMRQNTWQQPGMPGMYGMPGYPNGPMPYPGGGMYEPGGQMYPGMPGSMAGMKCYQADWNNGAGIATLRCPPGGGSCDDAGMARSLSDPRYSNVREISCSSIGSGMPGGGGTMGGGMMPSNYPWGCSFGATTELNDGRKFTSAMCPLESQSSNTCTGVNAQGSQSFQPANVKTWGNASACASMGGSGYMGTTPSMQRCFFPADWKRSDGTTFGGSVSCLQDKTDCREFADTGTPVSPGSITFKGAATSCYTTGGGNYGGMGGGGTMPGGTYGGGYGAPSSGGGTSGQRCFYNNATKDGQSLGYSVNCTSNGADCRRESESGSPVEAGLTLGSPGHCYPAPTGGYPSGSYPSGYYPSGSYPSGSYPSGSMSCDQMKANCKATCQSDSCRSGCDSMMCGSGSYSSPAGGSTSGGSYSSSPSSGGGTSPTSSGCPSNKWSFAQATRPDGTAIPPFTCTNGVCDAGVSLDGINWGPSTCVSAGGGIFHAIGTLLRSVVAGF
jgi:hypothetical protein